MNNRHGILEFLNSNKNQWISGEEISRELGISRTAVWKNINVLKEKGYVIESCSKLGHKLISDANIFDEFRIRNNLETMIFGQKDIIIFKETDSTNIQAFKLANEGLPEGSVVLAESQLKGKGRLGRSWTSVPGHGIYMSLVLRPPIMPSQAPGFTIVSSIAITDTLDHFGIKDYEIKWPNDILINQKKAVGILTEMKADPDHIEFIIIGIGINLNTAPHHFPEEVKNIAYSIRDSVNEDIDRSEFLKVFLTYFEKYYNDFLNDGFNEILGIWRRKSGIINKRINVSLLNETFSGNVLDINDDGFLRVQTESGERLVNSGDIHFI